MHFGQNEKSFECGPNFPKRMLHEQMPHVPDTDIDEPYQRTNFRNKILSINRVINWRVNKEVSMSIIGTLQYTTLHNK